jgi:hypothetical protein
MFLIDIPFKSCHGRTSDSSIMQMAPDATAVSLAPLASNNKKSPAEHVLTFCALDCCLDV